MTAFIVEYWWQVAVYLIGCVLAYGRVYAFMCAYTKESQQQLLPWDIISAVVWVILSWIGFVMIAGLWQKGDKFFKWVPVLLLWCMVGVGCEPKGNNEYHYPVIYSKNYARLDGNGRHAATQLPSGICYFRACYAQDFEDSCNKYKVGDTLWLGKKTQQ